MSVFVPKGVWKKPSGYVASQKSVDEWWEKNKDKRWSPTLGLYSADDEPTDDQLREIETRQVKSFRGSINSSFKHLSRDHEKFVVECEKGIDSADDQGYVSIREVVSASVTSHVSEPKTPKQIVPSSNSLAVLSDGDGKSTVVPESDTSLEMNRRYGLTSDSIPSLCKFPASML